MFSPVGTETSCVAFVKVSNGCTGGNTLSKSIDPSRSNCDICLEISSVPEEPPVNDDPVVPIGFGGADAMLSAFSDGSGELPTGIDTALTGLGPTSGGPAGLDGVGGGISGLKGIGGGPVGRDGIGGGPGGLENVGGGPVGLNGVGGGPSGREKVPGGGPGGLEKVPGGGPGGLEGRGGRTGGFDGKDGADGADEFPKFLGGIGGGPDDPPTASS